MFIRTAPLSETDIPTGEGRRRAVPAGRGLSRRGQACWGGFPTVAMRICAPVLFMLAVGMNGPAASAQGIGVTIGGPWGGMAAPAPQPGQPGAGPYAPYDAPPAGRAGRQGLDANGAVNMLRGRGFTNIEVIRQRGAMIILEANGPRGERVQLVVDGASGAISGMKVIGFGDKRY